MQIGVVGEGRPYTHWASSASSKTEVGTNSGIVAAKAELNALHSDLANQGFTQVRAVDDNKATICVTGLALASRATSYEDCGSAVFP